MPKLIQSAYPNHSSVFPERPVSWRTSETPFASASGVAVGTGVRSGTISARVGTRASNPDRSGPLESSPPVPVWDGGGVAGLVSCVDAGGGVGCAGTAVLGPPQPDNSIEPATTSRNMKWRVLNFFNWLIRFQVSGHRASLPNLEGCQPLARKATSYQSIVLRLYYISRI